MQEVAAVVVSIPDNRGKGVFYWEPTANNGLRTRGYFDTDGNVLPVIDAFHRYTSPHKRVDGQ